VLEQLTELTPPWVLSACGGVIGLLVGSFLNVVVWRVPRGESLIRPASACPRCGHPIRPRDNIPVLSWLLLRGRCRDCAAPISRRYPVVELGTGIAFSVVVAVLGLRWELGAALCLTAIGITLALIDLEHKRLPDPIVLAGYLVTAAFLLAPGLVMHRGDDVVRGLISGAALFALYFLMLIVYPGGMGFGDVKLAGLLGLVLGWVGYGTLAVGAFSAFLLGGIFTIVLLAAGRARRGTAIPFGPWMIAGAVVGVAAGESIWNAYLGVLS
jgi:leader peptidase (prepilin peptidase)/N-methyltransferase